MACFMAPWCTGANINPRPTSLIQRSICNGVRLRLTPRVSKTSEEPLLLETDRLPCLATRPPAAATTKVAAVETLNRFAPSPPVPTRSMRWVSSTCTGIIKSRITSAAPAISSMVSPLMRNATNQAPIWAGVASPVITCIMTVRI